MMERISAEVVITDCGHYSTFISIVFPLFAEEQIIYMQDLPLKAFSVIFNC